MCDPFTYVYSQLGMALQSNMVLARRLNSLQAFCLSHPIPSHPNWNPPRVLSQTM